MICADVLNIMQQPYNGNFIVMLETLEEIVKVCKKLEKLGYQVNLLVNDGYFAIEIPIEKGEENEETLQADQTEDQEDLWPNG